MMMRMMMRMRMTKCRQDMPSDTVALRRCPMVMLLALSLSLRCVYTTEISGNSDETRLQQQPYIGDVGLGGEWGLPDIVATVGRLICYQLPKYDTNLGYFTNYKVTAANENGLPPWLTFNEETFSIEGVPTTNVTGQMYNILVSADSVKPSGGQVNSVNEYFNIRVSDREGILSGEDYTPLTQVPSNRDNDFRNVRCQPNAAVTTATVIIDADEGSFLAKERVNLLRKVSSHLGLPVQMVRLAPSNDDRQLFDDSALVAGPGDIEHQQSHNGLLVQWNVGCGNVFAEHMPVLELLEVTSSNGSMTKAIGYGIVGWHITSKKPPQLRRLRRQLHINSNPTATTMPSVMRPTGQPAVPTRIVSEVTSYTDIPETRIVPTTTSAVSPDITKTSPLMPTWPYRRDSSTVRLTKSPIPTTTYVTITPTRVLSAMTSTVDVVESSSTPSWPIDAIEPTVGMQETTIGFHSTELLPSWTTTGFMTDSVLETVFQSLTGPVTRPLPTPSKLSTSKVTRRPPKTLKPDSKMTSTESPNMAPVVSKRLAVIEAQVGKLLIFRIPDDLFIDREDGGAEALTLLFLQHDDQTVDPPSWIKLNEASRTLYGLPLEEHIGMHNYQLAAADRWGKLAKTPCNVSVEPQPVSRKPSHELSVTLDLDFDKVFYDLDTRVNLINKIAAAFGDKDASKMTITRISPGSVVISWTNDTIPIEPCPEKQIQALLKHLLLPNGTINETFVKAMEPYRVLKADATYLGSCVPLDSHETSEPDEMKTTEKPMGVEVKPREQPENSLLLLILIPLVIFAVLLIVILICVVCYKKHKRRQKEQEKVSGLHKGIPIIFADELNDKPDTPTSTLKSRSRDDEEKQSVPPPEYPRSKPASQSSTLRSDYKSPLLTDNEDDEEQDEQEEELGNGTAPPTLPRQVLQTHTAG